MNTPPDGGPAFPVPNDVREIDDGTGTIQAGMTMRDWFAGQALVGILAKLPLIDQTGELGKSVPDKIKLNDDIADSCYCIADAMLKSRGSV